MPSDVLSCPCRRVSGQKGGEAVIDPITFVLSIVASVIAYYICKRLDGK